MLEKKIMILGAGVFQLPLIEKAKKLGLYTIVVSSPGDYPGFNLSDKNYFIDTRNKDEILNAAKEENISAIITDQTDIAVPSAAYVAGKLGLKGISYDTALKFTDKFLMRSECKKNGIKVPDFYKANNIDEAVSSSKLLKFPFIIKPVDNQGSRGISIIKNEPELIQKFPEAFSNSKSGSVILEQFIKGKEIVVEGIVSDFRDYNLSIGDRDYFDLPELFIPRHTLFPSLISEELKEKVLKINCKLIESFKPDFGITHSEYLIEDNTEEVYLVESAVRGGGVFISSDLIPLATGFNPDLYLIKKVLGFEYPANPVENLLSNSSGYICFTLPEGIIDSIEGIEKLNELEGVHRVYLDNLSIGKKITSMKDKSMRFGPIIIKGKNRQELAKIISSVEETLNITVDTHEGPRGIIWK